MARKTRIPIVPVTPTPPPTFHNGADKPRMKINHSSPHAKRANVITRGRR